MDIDVLIEIGIESQLNGIRADPGEGGLGGLLHHVTHLAGDRKVTAAFCNVGFHKEYVAAYRRPGEADDNTGAFHTLFDFFFQHVLRRTKEFLHDLNCDHEPGILAFENSSSLLATDARDLALEIPHARLARVMANDVM